MGRKDTQHSEGTAQLWPLYSQIVVQSWNAINKSSCNYVATQGIWLLLHDTLLLPWHIVATPGTFLLSWYIIATMDMMAHCCYPCYIFAIMVHYCYHGHNGTLLLPMVHCCYLHCCYHGILLLPWYIMVHYYNPWLHCCYSRYIITHCT